MWFSGYAELWANRPVRALFIAAFFARIPVLAAPLVFTLYVVGDLDGTYTQAGIVAASSTIGAAFGSPWRGRLIDRLGMRRAILPSIIAVAVLYPFAASSTYAYLVPLSFLMGLFLIPVFSMVRLSLSVMLEERQRRIAFSADSIVSEASFIIGPAAGALLVTQFSAGTALYAVGACEAFAGLMLLRLNPPTRSVKCTDDEAPEQLMPGHEQPWMSVPMAFLFLISAGAVTALIATDLSIVAELRHLDEVRAIGFIYALWGVSSLLGGLIYGLLRRSIRPTYLLLALGLTTIPVGLGASVWSLALWVIPAGFLCAPTMTAAAEWVAKLAPRSAEARRWGGRARRSRSAALRARRSSVPRSMGSAHGAGSWSVD